MAFVVTARGTNDSNTTAQATISLGPFTPTANSLLLVHGQAEQDFNGANDPVAGTPSGGSLTFTARGLLSGATAVGTVYEDIGGFWSAPVGGSPSATTVTWDASSTHDAWYAIGALDITGHDVVSPIVQVATPQGADLGGGVTSPAETVTLTSTAVVGNLVVVGFAASDDAGAAMAAPTYGGQAMTAAFNNSPNAYMQNCVYYRVVTGTEASNVITCSDMGGLVYKTLAYAIEIAAASSTPTASGTPADRRDTASGVAVSGTTPTANGAPTDRRDTASGSATRTLPTATASGAMTERRDVAHGTDSVLRFPTTVSGRNLLDQTGQPWLGVGDTNWSMVGQFTDSDIIDYLGNRADKGVNLILMSAPENHYADDAPNNIDGAPAFTGTAFQSALNNAYWTRMDLIVSTAADLGITLLVCPFYIGFSDSDGWGAQVAAASNAQMRAYAQNINARYGSATNIVWMIGHDRPVLDATQLARADAWVDEFRTLNNHLITFGGFHPFDDNGTDTWGWGRDSYSGLAADPDFDTQYDYSTWTGQHAYAITAVTPTQPLMFIEGIYEQEQGVGIGAATLRRQIWAPFVAGACAVIFGNNPIWHGGSTTGLFPFTGTWQDNMDYAGSTDLEMFATITSTLGTAWGATVGDSGSTFVTTQGTDANRVSARFSGNLGLVYHPNFASGTITLDLTEFAGSWSAVSVTRYDPRSGATTLVGSYPTTGTQNLSAPAANSAGDRDWLYVVEGIPTPTGAGSPTDRRDTAAGAATVSINRTAAGAMTERRDVAAGVASSGLTRTASGSPSDRRDTATGSAVSTPPASPNAAGAATERRDAAAGVANVGTARTATGSMVERRDSTTGAATAAAPSVSASGALLERRDLAASSPMTLPGVVRVTRSHSVVRTTRSI